MTFSQPLALSYFYANSSAHISSRTVQPTFAYSWHCAGMPLKTVICNTSVTLTSLTLDRPFMYAWFFSVIEIIHPKAALFFQVWRPRQQVAQKVMTALLWINEKHLRIQLFLSASSSIPAGHSHLAPTGLNKHRWLQPPLLPWQSLEPTSRRIAQVRWVHFYL